MGIKVWTISLICLLTRSNAQQSSSTLQDFVGQLTTLFNQNGGLASLGSAIQQASGYGYPPQGYPGYQPGYPQPGYPQSGYPQPGYQQPGYPQVNQPQQPVPGRPEYRPPGGVGLGQGQLPYPQQQPYPYQGYPPLYPPVRPGFLNALNSISQYDDLKCVPRLLCEVTSGGKPGYVGAAPSVVPLTSKDTLITLLTIMNFVDDSPLLTFGRAALLGYTARGNSRACLTAYPTCPRDPDALVDYLNNHNGGFFRFFNSQLLGQIPSQQPPYPYQQPQQPYRKIKNGNYASHYTQPQNYYYQSRIQNKPGHYTNGESSFYLKDDGKVVTFPEDFKGPRGGRKLFFPQDGPSPPIQTTQPVVSPSPYPYPTISDHPNRLPHPAGFFPDRTGTGDLRLDVDAFGDYKGVYYASNGPPENLINFRDQRSIKFPKDHIKNSMHFPVS